MVGQKVKPVGIWMGSFSGEDHEFLLAALARNGDTLRYVDEPWILDLTPRISCRILVAGVCYHRICGDFWCFQ